MLRTRLAAVAFLGCAATMMVGSTASAKAPGGAQVAPEVGGPVAAAVKAYRTVYPSMTAGQAETAARQQETRKALYGRVAGGTFGGAWFDAPSGVTHVAVTTPAAETAAAAAGASLGLKVTTHRVARSFTALEAQAAQVRAGAGAVGKAARGHVGIDVRQNRVVASVPAAQLVGLRGQAGGVALTAAGRQPAADAGCTSRAACDYTVRAGAMLWTGSAGNNVCSVGFTARTSTNQRYVYTAGHCSGGNGITWGTGALPIGPMQASIDSGAYDASIIRVTNGWFAYDQGGEIYQTVYVNGVAPTLGYIWAGDTVCLSANYTNPTGPNYCGVIGTNSDPAVRGMARVDGLDACPGDSGGGWYWLTSSGRRIAYGMHSRSDNGCHGSSGGSHSWFSPLPTVKAGWTPGLNVEVRP